MRSRRARAKTRRRPSAYTLIELLIVIAVLGLAGALLIPRLVDSDTFAIQSAVRTVIADITFAQSDALATQEYRRVHFYEDGSGYCIIRVTDSTFDTEFDAATAEYINDPLAPVGEFGAYIVNFADDDRFNGVDIDIITFDGGNTHLTFDQLGGTVTTGGVPGTGGNVVLRSPSASYQVSVSAFTGKITVTKVIE